MEQSILKELITLGVCLRVFSTKAMTPPPPPRPSQELKTKSFSDF